MGGVRRGVSLRHGGVSGTGEDARTAQREAEPDHRRALRLRGAGGAGKGAPSAVGVGWGLVRACVLRRGGAGGR